MALLYCFSFQHLSYLHNEYEKWFSNQTILIKSCKSNTIQTGWLYISSNFTEIVRHIYKYVSFYNHSFGLNEQFKYILISLYMSSFVYSTKTWFYKIICIHIDKKKTRQMILVIRSWIIQYCFWRFNQENGRMVRDNNSSPIQKWIKC